MKILHVTIWDGRVDHLTKCIESWSNIISSGHEITRLIVAMDDPKTRNENILEMLGKVHNCLLWRNPTEIELQNWAKNQNYERIVLQNQVISAPIELDKQY